MSEKNPAVSFDQIIQEGRKKRQAERLAQEIFGKNRRSSAPAAGPKTGALSGSLASRVGIAKRNSSLTRSKTERPTRAPTPQNPRADERPAQRPSRLQNIELAPQPQNNGLAGDELNGGDGLSIRGAARTSFTVVASNFAPGTTAMDIESVMESVGGSLSRCSLVASRPTVIAEIDFNDKTGAEKVVDTFNGKKADGRVLYVYMKAGSRVRDGAEAATSKTLEQPSNATPINDDMNMEVDENAISRDAQDRLREERRGRDDRDNFPTGPRNQRDGYDTYYDRRPRRSEPSYMDKSYGFASDRYVGGGRGQYHNNRASGYRSGGGWLS